MKILSILNVSNRERLGADSGVIFHRLLFERLARAGAECVIAAPVDLALQNVRWAAFESGSNKYDVRFRFDWDATAQLLVAEKPDVLFVNQVEQTSHFRALLVTLGLPTRLIAYCHYWLWCKPSESMKRMLGNIARLRRRELHSRLPAPYCL